MWDGGPGRRHDEEGDSAAGDARQEKVKSSLQDARWRVGPAVPFGGGVRAHIGARFMPGFGRSLGFGWNAKCASLFLCVCLLACLFVSPRVCLFD